SGDVRKPGRTEVAYDRTPLKALESQVTMWKRVTRDLPSITQPVLLMHSPQDHVVRPEASDTLLARISSTDVTELLLERSFHVATLDHDAPLVEDESVKFIRRTCEP